MRRHLILPIILTGATAVGIGASTAPARAANDVSDRAAPPAHPHPATPTPTATSARVTPPTSPAPLSPATDVVQRPPKGEFITNGGFEQVTNCGMGCDASGWTNINVDTVRSVTAFHGAVHSGAHALALQVADYPTADVHGMTGVSQRLVLPNTTSPLILSYFGATEQWNLKQQGHARAVIVADGVRHTVVDESLNGTPGGMNGVALWMHHQVDVSAYRGEAITLEFEASLPAVLSDLGTATFHVDDVTLTAPIHHQFVSNGGFERVQNCTAMGCDAADWTSTGSLPHPIFDYLGSHSGSYALTLEVEDNPPGAPTPGTASVTQQVTLPATAEQLTLMYWAATTNWHLRQQGHARAVIIADGVRHVVVDDSLNTTPGTMGAHPVFALRQADVSAYRGKTVSLVFEAALPTVIPNTAGFGEFHVDDVSLTD